MTDAEREEREAENERRVRERMANIMSASRLTQEMLDAVGFKGSPGFMGTGSYTGANRSPGYGAK